MDKQTEAIAGAPYQTRRGTIRKWGREYATTEVYRTRFVKPTEGVSDLVLPPAEVVGHVRLLEGGMYRWVGFPFGGAPLDCGDVATVAAGVEAVKEYVAKVDARVRRVQAREVQAVEAEASR